MDSPSRSEHPSDAALLERLLVRMAHPHLAGCARCAARSDAIARTLDPIAAEGAFDDAFYRRQANHIRARVAGAEGPPMPRWRRSVRPMAPRLAYLGGAIAAAVALAVTLRGPGVWPESGRRSGEARVVVAGDFQSAQDLADDRLLREVDATLDEDSYDFAPSDG
jgi:hypothetical protein